MGKFFNKLRSTAQNWRRLFNIRALVAIILALGIGAAIGGIAMFLSGETNTVAGDPEQEFVAELNRDPTIKEQLAQQIADDQFAIDLAQSEEQSTLAETPGPVEPTSLPSQNRIFGLDEQGALPPALSNPATGGPRVAADPALLQTGINGPLPIISEDGRHAFEVYARPTPVVGVPKVSIVVMDLGLNSKLAADSIQLPPEVALGFSPYMAHGDAWHRYARGHGHETVLRLPIMHSPQAARDEGPLSIDVGWSEQDMVTGLNRVLGRATGYVAVAATPGRFREHPTRFAPIVESLKSRGVGFVELGEVGLTATVPDLAFARATIELDRQLTPAGIENQLRILERQAEVTGQAIGFTRAYPLVFDRIWHWANNLDNSRIALVPLSSLLKS